MKKFIDKIKNFVIENKVGIASILAVSAVIAFGFSSKVYWVKVCSSTVTKYVTAEFSEDSSYMDGEGNFVADRYYWSEPASEVYSITKRNEMPEYPPIPPHDTSMSSDYDFDNFKFHTDAKTTVFAEVPGDSTKFSVNISKAAKCLAKINDVVIVKTWYTITYDSDF